MGSTNTSIILDPFPHYYSSGAAQVTISPAGDAGKPAYTTFIFSADTFFYKDLCCEISSYNYAYAATYRGRRIK